MLLAPGRAFHIEGNTIMDIKQELGFDASQTFEVLAKLESGFQSFEQKLKGSYRGRLQVQ